MQVISPKMSGPYDDVARVSVPLGSTGK